MTVLIVEDNPISATVLEHTLDKHAFETLTARDGEEALEFLEAHPEIELVITDIMMPNTDGIELVRTIKNRPEWSEIPILVCTSIKPGSLNDSVPMQGWEYVFKPIRAKSLMQKVSEALARQKPVLQKPVLQKPDQTMSEIGMDSAAFNEVLEEFLKVVKNTVDLLEQGVKQVSKQPLDFQHLLEGARLIRAERVIDILDRLNQSPAEEKPEIARSTYPLLLRELKAAQHCLALYTA
jgi:CheY-like chemotaxis protein